MAVVHTLDSEPDNPQLKLASRFILAVAIFVAASMVGLRGWLGDQMSTSLDVAAETRR
jgi:hypothetical protein